MKTHTIDVRVEEAYRGLAESDVLRDAARETLKLEQVGEACELVVALAGDDALRELNRRHRGVDAATDVLAFPHRTKGPAQFSFVDAPGFPRYLGDVVISLPQAEAQANDAGNTLPAELQLLVVHGVLHLLGYDDQTASERARMWKVQKAVLDGLDVEVNLPE